MMRADAERARAEEEARKARIQTGTDEIDRVFGGFDDSFFNSYRDNFTNLYLPELNQQFGDAKDQLTFGLARAGTLKSSMAGEQVADLTGRFDKAKTGIVADATGAAADLRGQVNNEKSSLISLLNATGDADRASNEALARSQQLFQRQPGYNPLGDIFGGAAQGIGNFMAQQQNQRISDAYFGRGTGASSGRVVR
jgi:hypothetical protein